MDAQWQRVAAPIVMDFLAAVAEFSLAPDEADFPAPLLRRYRAAGQRRDAEALRQACDELKREALRRMLASETRRAA